MENNTQKIEIDPIGIGTAISILSGSLLVFGVTIEVGSTIENKRIKKYFRKIRTQVLDLQNSLDDLILLLNRVSSESQDLSFGSKRSTISDTLMQLSEVNYRRYISIQNSIEKINRNIYDIISQIRADNLRGFYQKSDETIDKELLSKFDNLMLKLSDSTFEDFIQELRGCLNALSSALRKYQ